MKNSKLQPMPTTPQSPTDLPYITEIKAIIRSARQKAYAAVNTEMVEAYWLVGKRIVEVEQQGEERAEYGKTVLKNVSKALTAEFGSGFSITNVKNFRSFYKLFADYRIGQTLSDQFANPEKRLALLHWSHYERLIRVENREAREWYMREAAKEMWSFRTLDRNISTQYYHRLLASQVKEPVVQEMQEKTKTFQNNKLEFIKNPTVLEFLGLPGNTGHSEANLESAIIDHLQKFILELGKGFAFIARQQLIRTETTDYYIDLVFYNYILKCFVLIDLKTTRITHQDVGQMDMYVRMFDERKRSNDDNPTIGLILCSETDTDIAKYSILQGNERLFASKYKLYLPTEEELAQEIEKQKEFFLLQHQKKPRLPHKEAL